MYPLMGLGGGLGLSVRKLIIHSMTSENKTKPDLTDADTDSESESDSDMGNFVTLTQNGHDLL